MTDILGYTKDEWVEFYKDWENWEFPRAEYLSSHPRWKENLRNLRMATKQAVAVAYSENLIYAEQYRNVTGVIDDCSKDTKHIGYVARKIILKCLAHFIKDLEAEEEPSVVKGDFMIGAFEKDDFEKLLEALNDKSGWLWVNNHRELQVIANAVTEFIEEEGLEEQREIDRCVGEIVVSDTTPPSYAESKKLKAWTNMAIKNIESQRIKAKYKAEKAEEALKNIKASQRRKREQLMEAERLAQQEVETRKRTYEEWEIDGAVAGSF